LGAIDHSYSNKKSGLVILGRETSCCWIHLDFNLLRSQVIYLATGSGWARLEAAHAVYYYILLPHITVHETIKHTSHDLQTEVSSIRILASQVSL